MHIHKITIETTERDANENSKNFLGSIGHVDDLLKTSGYSESKYKGPTASNYLKNYEKTKPDEKRATNLRDEVVTRVYFPY